MQQSVDAGTNDVNRRCVGQCDSVVIVGLNDGTVVVSAIVLNLGRIGRERIHNLCYTLDRYMKLTIRPI